MIAIPGGSFMMGSDDGDSDEKPVHLVTIEPFKLMDTEVTLAMYQPCIDAGVCPDNQQEYAGEDWGKGNLPVMNVSWNDITKKFIPWLNQQTGQSFRLATEAEWEYAARAGTQTPFSTGNCINSRQANYDGNYDYKNCSAKIGTYLREITPVKSYQPNAFGLYDMHGNVWEWVQDCWNDSYIGAPADGSAWLSGDCDRVVFRGGAWLDAPLDLRSANRVGNSRTGRYDAIGFRLAQDL
ncbi:formylglycine-generating enzyme family protein [Planctobacterium marinum]|uniref:Protein 3-oxoalanine-generating enzyme family protein n=1 Tax=Planctobacterium marinum TaxID=1631968 RepID=A0AA48KSD0_9ALTE|nr:protein 3-oxoalanine-generating enzyme family protein [Planctobacterium marinum]